MQKVLRHAFADRPGCSDADHSTGSCPWAKGFRHGGVRTGDVIGVPRVQVKVYRNSVMYLNLVSLVDCSVLNWVEQKELRGLCSEDRSFGRIAEPGWILMDFNNSFRCRMGDVDLSHIQFNPKLWNF